MGRMPLSLSLTHRSVVATFVDVVECLTTEAVVNVMPRGAVLWVDSIAARIVGAPPLQGAFLPVGPFL